MPYIKNYDFSSENFWTPEEYKALTGHTRVKRFLTIHKTEGPRDASIEWLRKKQGSKSVSANVVIDTNGTRYYLVDSKNIAWHCYTAPVNQKSGPYRALWGYGNENADSIGAELVGNEGDPLTEDQYASLAEYIIEEGIAPDRLHMVEHLELSSVKSDPQDPPNGFSFDKLGRYLAVPPIPEPKPTVLYFKETDKHVRGGFKDLWLKYGLEVCGYPLTEEYVERVEGVGMVTFQLFENVRFQWYSGIQPRIDALGRDYLKLKEK